MCNMEQRLEKIKAYTQLALDEFLVIRCLFDLLEPLGTNHNLAKRYSKGLSSIARQLLYTELYFDCSLNLLAISVDDDRRAASIKNILRLLQQEDLKNEIKKAFSQFKNDYSFSESFSDEMKKEAIKNIQKKHELQLQKEFDDRYNALEKEFKDLESRKICERLRKVRDKIHAHKEMISPETIGTGRPRLKPIEEIGLKVDDLENFMDAVEKLLDNLYYIVCRSSISRSIIKEENKLMAAEFWNFDNLIP